MPRPIVKNLLLNQFAEGVFSIEKLEKHFLKLYQKMEKAAYAGELAKCLSPVSTDNIQHLARIKLLRIAIDQKPVSSNVAQPLPNIKLKKASAEQDLEIIATALKFQNEKLAHYEFLHPMASALELETEGELIEQTITDNRNTNTWLRQILQNIIAPKLK